MPKVSIVVPMYNASAKITRCVDSLRNQSFSDIEVILIDDGSTDDGIYLCQNMAEIDSRIHVYHQENAGVSAARNTGIEKATGDWLMFVDADDWVEPDAVHQMVQLVESEGLDVGVCSFYNEFVSSSSVVKLNNETFLISDVLMEYGKKYRFETILCTIWNKIYRREIITAHGIRFERSIKLGEDFIFNAHFFQYVQTLKATEAVLYHYDCTSENSGVKKLYSNYDTFIYAMDQAVCSLVNAVSIASVHSNAFRGNFISARWQYAVDVCLSSAMPIEEQGELICKWFNAMPPEMRAWDALKVGETGRLLQLWSNDRPTVPQVCKAIEVLRKERKKREMILRWKRFVRKVVTLKPTQM